MAELDFEWLLKETSPEFVEAVRADYDDMNGELEFTCDVTKWKAHHDNSHGWIIVRLQHFIYSHFHQYYIGTGIYNKQTINQEWYEGVVEPFMKPLSDKRKRRGY